MNLKNVCYLDELQFPLKSIRDIKYNIINLQCSLYSLGKTKILHLYFKISHVWIIEQNHEENVYLFYYVMLYMDSYVLILIQLYVAEKFSSFYNLLFLFNKCFPCSIKNVYIHFSMLML
jgi:hypothetical protein